jgi:alkanesulfonate monooxygenase SsuD/methylene tetrahydromethanopterin reductase-like flavin-dependent oxidoreductase (luciferase family)
MRFGIFDHNDDTGMPPARQLGERLRLLEVYDRLGFYAYHLAEHHGTPLSITPSPHLFLAAASQRTSSLRLGTLITILPLYHPVRLIEEVCILDQLTGGRLDLGIGRGISPVETGFFGVPADETPDRFAEAMDILRLGLTSGSVDYHGRFYDLSEVPVVVRPLQQPHPPLWYGVRVPERAVWAARQGLRMMALLPSERVKPLTDAYYGEWKSVGHTGAPLAGVNRMMVLADSQTQALRIANRAFGRHLRSFELLWRQHRLPMPKVYPADTFTGLHESGIAYAGTPAGAREFIDRERQLAGINYLAVDMAFGDMTLAESTRSAELFAAEVMPAFGD